MFDCIIVGAGPAGATAAYHLAKQKKSVLVVDKASLPRSKPCGGGVSPQVAQWFDFDFAPVINNQITKVQYSWKMGDTVQSKLNMKEPMWMVQRDIFDHFIIQQAQKQGIELKDNTEVTSIEFNQDSWQVNTNNGNFSAHYLIAADGATGLMSKWLGFPQKQQFMGATLEIEALLPTDQQNTAYFDFGSLKNGYIWNFPKANGYSICAGVLRGKKGKPEELKKQLINYATQFGIDLTNSQYYQYPLSLWTENQFLHSDHALLVGEAAGIVDPLTGEGIRPSIFTGYKAAEAINQSVAGNTDSLAEYSRIVNSEWGADMVLAQRLAGLFYQFPKIAYKVGVKRPTAAQIMGKILCGELRYSDVTEQAIKRLKSSLIPGRGNK